MLKQEDINNHDWMVINTYWHDRLDSQNYTGLRCMMPDFHFREFNRVRAFVRLASDLAIMTAQEDSKLISKE